MSDETFSLENLTRLYRETPETELAPDARIVIFSDLHLGNGGRTDDFLPNSELFLRALRDYYLPRGDSLLLNGDIEELQRFSLPSIRRRWRDVYEVFDSFEARNRLHRLVGNHDLALIEGDHRPFEIAEALRLRHHGNTIFVFHGHQTALRFAKYNHLVEFVLRYLANPLRITNTSVAHDSLKRFRTEERVYEFASSMKVLSIIGHTHRPLFESMSKLDSIKFEIERLCRKYPKVSMQKQRKIERSIEQYKRELARINEDDDPSATVASLYNANLVVPCMFNSGTVIGKRGMTCLEITEGRIALVHWFDDRKSDKYLRYSGYSTEQLPGTDFHRVVIKSDSLDYIFSRIRLLA
jgi:UDP-2,3-diacylglucosamine pyrophosphatase LpxH